MQPPGAGQRFAYTADLPGNRSACPVAGEPCGTLMRMTDDAALAEDDEEYEDEPGEASAPGLAVTALAGATTAAAGYYAGGAGGAAIFAAATPFLAALFQKGVDKIGGDRLRRADKMLETAGEAAGLTREQLADRAMESEETRFLTDKAIKAAADTIWPEGIRAIGRAYAAGLLAKDKPTLDIRLRVLGIMQGLDEMHVSLLELLVNYQPDMRHDGLRAIPHSIPSYQNRLGGGDRPDNPKFWSAGRRKWATGQISAVRPQLQLVLGSLLGELRVTGLAEENDTAPQTAKRVGDDLAKQVNRQARGAQQRGRFMQPVTLQPTIRAAEPTWSPTELGEMILAFYAEAGAEDIADLADDSVAGDS
jgi:hypothetical protein